MKKVFVQFKQWILKYRKRLIYGALALFIFQIGFFSLGGIQNEVFADTPNTPTNDANFAAKAQVWINNMSFYKIVIYIIIYPILVIAGKLVDNSLVYAEVFNFDTVLWNLWTIARNLATYSLGFVFVYKVFEALINSKGGGEIKKILVPTLIAGVGIQASWFVMGVLIDISTVLTYGVGGLPITILGNSIVEDQNKIENNPYVYQTLVYFDGKNPDQFDLFLSNTQSGSTSEKFYISKCRLFTYGSTGNESKETLIIGPKYVYYKTNNTGGETQYFPTKQVRCHNDSKVYQFSSLYVKWETAQDVTSGASWNAAQLQYNANVDDAIRKITTNEVKLNDVQTFIKEGKILQIGDAHEPGGITGAVFRGIRYDNPGLGLDVYNQHIGGSQNMKKLNDVLNIDGGSYVSVFNTLYSSLLHAGEDLRVSNSVSDATYVHLLNEILGIGHAIAIAIPLIGMAIVFMMRVGILWIAIALSPFIVLLTAFSWNDKILSDGALKYFNPKNLIPIIFSPAIVCFAVSLSTVLVRIIMSLNWQKIMTNEVEILGGLVRLDIAGLGSNMGKMMCSMMGIAITWFLVRAAVQSSELGKSTIVKNVKELAQNALGTMPIVPIPTKNGDVDFIGANAAFGLNGQTGILNSISDKIKNKYESRDTDTVRDLIDSSEVEGRLTKAYKSAIASHNFTSNDWTTEEVTVGSGGNTKNVTFRQLSGKNQMEIIEAINSLEENKRNALGNKNGSVVINDGENQVTYEFRDGKYQKQ